MGRWVWVILIVLLTALISCSMGFGGRTPRARNCVVVVIDTLAAQHLGYNGYQRDTSPYINELASKSVIFSRAYTPKSTTVPAFTSLMSARHPSSHGIIDNGVNVPDSIHFLTEDFQSAGFVTWGIPSVRHLGAQYRFDKGYDFYANTSAEPLPAIKINEKVERLLFNESRLGEPGFKNLKDPLFMMVHYYDTHTPYTPDPEVLAKFADPGYAGIVDGTGTQALSYCNNEIELDNSDLQQVRDLYDAEIRTLDIKIKELFGMLEDSGLYDNSVIVLTADHGENVGEHHYITHGHPYEKSLHIPLLMHFPGDRFAGTVIDTIVENTDIMPSLLDIFGQDAPDGIDGSSFMSLVSKAYITEYRSRDLFYSIGNPVEDGRKYGVFDGRYRLIADVNDNGEINLDENLMLYDIKVDPDEIYNLAGIKPEVIDRLIFAMAAGTRDPGDWIPVVADTNTRELLASLGYSQ